MTNNSIRGTRPGSQRVPTKQYSTASLMMGQDEASDLRTLYTKVWKDGANCTADPDWWTGDDLPSDREAQAACAGCPALDLCRSYAEAHEPAFGVWGGKVYGREEDSDG